MSQVPDQDVSMEDAPPQTSDFSLRAIAESLKTGPTREAVSLEKEQAFMHAEAAFRAEQDENKAFDAVKALKLTSFESAGPSNHLPKPVAWTKGMNVFYNPAISFEQTAVELIKRLRRLASEVEKWMYSWPPDRFREFVRTKTTVLQRVGQSLQWMAELLAKGRQGWNFSHWSMEFFSELEELLARVTACLEVLAEYQGCGWLRQAAVLESVRGMGEGVGKMVALKRAEEEWRDKAFTRELEEAVAREVEEGAVVEEVG
ncbi:hypothetical protein B0A55_07024 [Friedmanniomyces simplex]|uniref:Uncharacterized protein n=1 Tax=Friedmanniomyces simplex TaxID=329884 RepID=A0A4U0XA15_9PEZI|nr:hypothetical protein B0A55_07024 [Friedmanniomyces simplex]